MARLVFASLITFGLLIGMVIGLVLAAMVAAGEVNLTVAIALTVVINLVIWLISPWLSDLTLRWFNQLEFLDDAAVKQRYPGVHQLIHEVADAYRFKAPRIGFIPDRNPTAFTYGLLRSNARIVVTQGIFEFLSEDEQRAVVAHELGHIVNRDFILMTMAGMLVQILYQIYAALVRSRQLQQRQERAMARSSGSRRWSATISASICCSISAAPANIWPTRSRRAAIEPRHLASALIKIAYGIVAVEDTEATQSLLRSTRHLGVIDVKNARYSGLLAESTANHAGAAAEAMLFDTYNPWAALVQLNSTHPLTGRRVAHLGEIAKAKGQAFADYDVAAAAAAGASQPRQALGPILGELLLLVGAAAARAAGRPRRRLDVGAGGHRRRRARDAAAALSVRRRQAATVMALMGDPGASPVRGQAGAARRQGHRPGEPRLHRRRGRHLPGPDRPHGGRFPLHARSDRQSVRRLEAGAEASRPAGRGHRLVPARHGRLPDPPASSRPRPDRSGPGRSSGRWCSASIVIVGSVLFLLIPACGQ